MQGMIEKMIHKRLEKHKGGYYHKVTSGDTLWTLSKLYDKNIQDLMDLNNINNVSIDNYDYILIEKR